MAAGSPKQWSLSPSAFERFLAWLDEGVDSRGQKYLETQRRLVQYFDRKNCTAPDELADETLNRVARRLAEGGDITDTPPARYCYIVARYVFLEDYRKPARVQVSVDGLAYPEVTADRERRMNRLDHCLENLAIQHRELILEYYHGDQRKKIENRRRLATKLGLTLNALSIRAYRIRDTLEECVRKGDDA